jgi:hypothetical protein
MFIRKSQRTYKGRTYTNYLLVESVRTAKGPRQRIVCSLGDLSPRSRQEWLRFARKMEAALRGQPEIFEEEGQDGEVAAAVKKVRQHGRNTRRRRARPSVGSGGPSDGDLVTVDASRVEIERSREGGTVYVGHQFWKRLELDDILARLGLSARTRAVTCTMVLNRLIYPVSEHAMPAWIRRTAIDDLLGIDFESLDENALYRNMDRLHPHRPAIEAELVERERTLFNLDQTVFLYDLTSTYFEGLAGANPKAKRGYLSCLRRSCRKTG